MKALIHNRFGPPEDALELVDLPDETPGSGEVLIRVEATPIHAGDLKNIAGEKTMIRNVETGEVRDIEGQGDMAVSFPQVPGIEGVGRVVEIGPDVGGVAVGDRVFLPLQCGSWREQVVAEAARLIPAPEGDAAQLALMVNAFTADFALRDLAPLGPGDWFVQNSANSNVGRVLIALARLRGIKTANIVRRAALVDELKALGADVVLMDGDDLPARLHAATDGAPLTIGLDGVAGNATGRLAECLSNGATVANFGLMSGEPCKIEPWILHYKRTLVRGYYAGFNLMERSFDEQKAIIVELADLIAAGKIGARIAATYPLENYREAVSHAAREGTAREGKLVFDLTAD